MVMTAKYRLRMFLILSLLLTAILACKLPGTTSAPAPTPIPVSTQAVEELATQVVQAASTAQAGGPIILEMTEAQLTSAAALQLQAQGEQSIQNVQVRLQNAQMIISGTTKQGGLDLPVTLVLQPTVDAQGVPKSKVVDAKVGPMSLPESVVNEISSRFDQLLIQQLGATSQAIAVDNITIADGKMTVTAHRR
jgi:uncharacterized protein YpmS